MAGNQLMNCNRFMLIETASDVKRTLSMKRKTSSDNKAPKKIRLSNKIYGYVLVQAISQVYGILLKFGSSDKLAPVS